MCTWRWFVGVGLFGLDIVRLLCQLESVLNLHGVGEKTLKEDWLPA
jgi:hypothetical protein